MKILNLLFNRAIQPVQRRAFRFSDAERETAGYRADLSGYHPIALPGDPVAEDRLPRREARALFEALRAMASQRRRILAGYLSGFGLQPGERGEDWQRIEEWLPEVMETSAEPADRQWPRLRPRSEALLLDLALAFSDAACAHHRGILRLGFEGEGLAQGVSQCDGFPVLLDGDGRLRAAPRAIFLLLGRNAANGTTAQRPLLADVWRSLSTPPDTDAAPDLVADLYRWVEAHEAERGAPPTLAELADYAVESRIAEEDVPRELIQRLSQT